MSGQSIGVSARLASAWKIFSSYQEGVIGDADKEIRYHRRLCEVIRTQAGVEVAGARILDIGCGQLAAQVALFAADGAQVTGIDSEVPTYAMSLPVFVRSFRRNGAERAVKSLARHLLFDRAWWKRVAAGYDRPVSRSGLDTRIMDARELRFPNDHFDFVCSAWTFEHIEDVPAAVREVDRVLKPTGVAHIAIHLFPSLSGGHHLDWAYPDIRPSRRVPPWDHLLEARYAPNTYLNRWRLDQYRQAFHSGLSVVDEERFEEGRSLLTPELRERLMARGYSEADLLTRAVTFICRKQVRPGE